MNSYSANWMYDWGNKGVDDDLPVAAILLLVGVGLLLLAFWIWMFLDALKNKKLNDSTRIVWGLGMIFIPPLALLYFLAARSRK